MNWPNKAQVYTGLRYAGVAVSTALTVGTALGAVDKDTAQAIIAQFHVVEGNLQTTFGSIAKLYYLVWPVAAVLLAKIGWASAALKSQIKAVQASPKANVIVTDPKLAEGIPGVKVQQ